MHGLTPCAEIALFEARSAPADYPPALLCARLIKKAWGLPVRHFLHYEDAPNLFAVASNEQTQASRFLADEKLIFHGEELNLSGDLCHEYLAAGFFIWFQLRDPPPHWNEYRNCVVFLDQITRTKKCFIPSPPRLIVTDLTPLQLGVSGKVVPEINELSSVTLPRRHASLARTSRTGIGFD